MLSCDTIALGRKTYAGGENLFAKNSDRPLGEAQPLVYIPGRSYPAGEQLRCTHLTIPQAEHTYSVLGAKPYWIWGFEMGVNEKGLAIGNEAQGSRCPKETEEGLLGMDLLRLALERSTTAREAIDVIAGLLEQYGQNANANMLYDRRYENSYMLVDRQEIWLMETAGREWAAKRIQDWAAISNCYTIGTDYDLCSDGMEAYARERRWLSPEEPVDFAKAYTDPAPRQTHSVPRWRRLCRLIGCHNTPLDLDAVKAIFRDHFDGEILEPRYGACGGGFITICMHAMTWDASQTAASLLCTYQEELGIVCRYAPSIPCCSVYLPLYWTGWLPEAMSDGGERYSESSLWWVMERLAMAISVDEDRYGDRVRKSLRELEAAIAREAAAAEETAVSLMRAGKTEEALSLLNAVMAASVEKTMTLADGLAMEIGKEVSACGGAYGPRKEFLEAYSQRVAMPLFTKE